MWFRSLLLAAGLLAFQFTCADPVPLNKSAYVGVGFIHSTFVVSK
jgi:hypothetical protein